MPSVSEGPALAPTRQFILSARQVCHRIPLSIGLLPLLLLTGGSGCGISYSYHFGQPPVAPLSTSPDERCLFKRRITIRQASITYENTDRLGNVVVITHKRVRGLTFYQGRRWVSAHRVLQAVDDPELAASYAALYEKMEKNGRRDRLIGWILVATSVATGAVGVGVLSHWAKTQESRTALGVGGSFAVVSAIAGLIGGLRLDDGIEYRDDVRAYRAMFLARDYQERLRSAVERFNARAEEACARGGH